MLDCCPVICNLAFLHSSTRSPSKSSFRALSVSFFLRPSRAGSCRNSSLPLNSSRQYLHRESFFWFRRLVLTREIFCCGYLKPVVQPQMTRAKTSTLFIYLLRKFFFCLSFFRLVSSLEVYVDSAIFFFGTS